mmetsp:Transcript_169202/g.537499  ORF Transcript_169202/g.537499 Transcript_169202/m.537499 type:complete len:462 (+) Transcript_169202:50-1435(+)
MARSAAPGSASSAPMASAGGCSRAELIGSLAEVLAAAASAEGCAAQPASEGAGSAEAPLARPDGRRRCGGLSPVAAAFALEAAFPKSDSPKAQLGALLAEVLAAAAVAEGFAAPTAVEVASAVAAAAVAPAAAVASAALSGTSPLPGSSERGLTAARWLSAALKRCLRRRLRGSFSQIVAWRSPSAGGAAGGGRLQSWAAGSVEEQEQEQPSPHFAARLPTTTQPPTAPTQPPAAPTLLRAPGFWRDRAAAEAAEKRGGKAGPAPTKDHDEGMLSEPCSNGPAKASQPSAPAPSRRSVTPHSTPHPRPGAGVAASMEAPSAAQARRCTGTRSGCTFSTRAASAAKVAACTAAPPLSSRRATPRRTPRVSHGGPGQEKPTLGCAACVDCAPTLAADAPALAARAAAAVAALPATDRSIGSSGRSPRCEGAAAADGEAASLSQARFGDAALWQVPEWRRGFGL